MVTKSKRFDCHMKDDGIDCDSLDSSGDLVSREGKLGETHSDSSMADSLEILPATPSSDIANFVEELLSAKEITEVRQCKKNGRKPSQSGIPKLISRANSSINLEIESMPLGCYSGELLTSYSDFNIKQNGSNLRNMKDKYFMTSTESFMSSVSPRETIASRLRYEKFHVEHDHAADDGDYVTPTQRKDVLLKDMRKEIKEMRRTIEERDETILKFVKNENRQATHILDAKNSEMVILRKEMETLKNTNSTLQASHDEHIRNVSALEATVQSMQVQLEQQATKSQEMYLEMYKKGQSSARFEREEELERLAKTGSLDKNKVTVTELLKKLSETESKLANWQAFRRKESYECACKPDTESEATLRFLRDSFYHYLTDLKDSYRHLRAMIMIFNFTDVQKKKIAASLVHDKKHKSK